MGQAEVLHASSSYFHGFVFAQHEGEVGANEMVGTEADLDRNLMALIEI
jgi:hypothetical protein